MHSFNLRFDSSEKLFQLSSTFEEYDFYNAFKSYVLEKTLAEILSDSFENFSDSLIKLTMVQSFRRAVYEYRGDVTLSETNSNKIEDLVCRCNTLFISDIKDHFQNVKGIKKEFLKNSKATMFCGQCSELVESCLVQLSQDFYNGKELSEYEGEVQKELDDFLMHSPYSSEQVSFELDKILPGKIRIRAKRSDKALKKEDMLKTLQEFFPRSLRQVFEISIVISDI